jgi:hypothetical protein
MTSNTIVQDPMLAFLEDFDTSTTRYQLMQGQNTIELNTERKNVVALYWRFTDVNQQTASITVNGENICPSQNKNYFTRRQQYVHMTSSLNDFWMYAFADKPDALIISGNVMNLPFSLVTDALSDGFVEIVLQYECSRELYDQCQRSIKLKEAVKSLETIYEKSFITAGLSFTQFLNKINEISVYKK